MGSLALNIKRREAKASDAEYIFSIAKRLSDIAGGTEAQYPVTGSPEKLAPLIESPHFEGWVYNLDGYSNPVGFISCSRYVCPRKAQYNLYVGDVWVEPEHRKQGIAYKMVQDAIAYAKQQNCESLEFFVSQKNEAAKKFFQKLGAVDEPARPMFIKVE